MSNRLIGSAIFGLAGGVVAGAMVIFLIFLYARHMARMNPGIGIVAGGLLPAMMTMVGTFLVVFLWSWRRK